MNRQEVEDYIYKSYLKAERFQDKEVKDEYKRNPKFSKDIIESLNHTPCVVVTGSKGKGSVSSMIAKILQSEMKVGLMTSPHLVNFNERFKVDGIDILNEDFIKHIELIKEPFELVEAQLRQEECISPMGIQTAAALSYFNEQGTEFNVFECGKGAKFDDVNNVKHEYAVINSIFLEHTRELGTTLREIAENKAAVITGDQKYVYVATQKPEVLDIIKKQASELNVSLKIYGEDFFAKNITYTHSGMVFDVVVGDASYQGIQIPLLGEYQARNAALALACAIDVLGEINIEMVKSNLKKMDWPGRMEVLSTEPFLMLDACIHRESCDDLLKVIKELKLGKITAIIGIPDDKDYQGVVERISEITDQVILTKSQNPHYLFTKRQEESLKKEGISVVSSSSIEEALERAAKLKSPTLILGTTSLISETKKLQYSHRLESIYGGNN